MRNTLVFILILLPSFLFSQELEQKFDNGLIYVDGKNYSRQIYMKQNNEIYQLSHFNNWELITSMYIDPTQKYLLVYHKSDKTSYYKITLYGLENRMEIATTEPAMACNDIKWYQDRIIYRSGTSGGGDYLFLYDYKLIKINVINNYGIYINLEEGICFSTPVYGAQLGVFSLYDLRTGALKYDFDFREETKEGYIFLDMKRTGNKKYQFTLQTFETDKEVNVEKIFD